MSVISDTNEVYDYILDLIEDAGLSNARDIAVKVYRRALPENFGKSNCPAISLWKDELSDAEIATDQMDLETPRYVRLFLGISDYDQYSSDYADELSEDLIQQVITLLEADPTLGGLVEGIGIPLVKFASRADESEGWFSEPYMILLMRGAKL